jgi:hypothetical protein
VRPAKAATLRCLDASSQCVAAALLHTNAGARHLRLIDDYARRSLDAQREWLDAVQDELERQQ